MSKSQRVEAIFNTFYKNRYEKKNIHLHSHVASYIKNKKGLDQFTANLDEISVEKLCDAYFIDVIRYKEYHMNPEYKKNATTINPMSEEWIRLLHCEEGKRLRLSKVAALTAKWILKYKPITLLVDENVSANEIDPQVRRIASFVNEEFALHHAFMLMKLNAKKIDINTHEGLLYHFKYRCFDERHFFLIFEMLEEKFK